MSGRGWMNGVFAVEQKNINDHTFPDLNHWKWNILMLFIFFQYLHSQCFGPEQSFTVYLQHCTSNSSWHSVDISTPSKLTDNKLYENVVFVARHLNFLWSWHTVRIWQDVMLDIINEKAEHVAKYFERHACITQWIRDGVGGEICEISGEFSRIWCTC